MALGVAEKRIVPEGGPWSPAYRLLTLGLVLTVTGAAFEALAIATVLPTTVDDLGGLALYGWSFSAFMLTNLVGIAVAGGEADLRGPARPFLFGVGLFVAGLLIGGFAPSMPVLIAGRALQGFGGGFIYSISYVVIGRGYPESGRPRMLAILSTAWVVPGLVGPAVAGLVADHLGWRWVFLGLAPLPVIAAAMALPAIQRTPPGDLAARDWLRIRQATQLAIGMTILLGGFQADNPLIGVAGVVIGAAVGLPALMRLLPAGTLLGRAGMPAAIAAMGLLNLGFFGVDAFVPLGLIDVRDRSTAFAGLALTSGTVGWSAGSWILARYSRHISRRLLVRSGLALIALGSAGIMAVLSDSVPALIGPLAWGIGGLGMGIAYTTLSLTVLETAPAGHEGTSTAAMQLANSIGMALATGVGGILIATFSSGDDASATSLAIQDVLMIGALAVAMIVAMRLPERTRDPEDEPSAPLVEEVLMGSGSRRAEPVRA